MKRIDISEYEGTHWEDKLDAAIDKAGFYDDIYITPDNDIIVIEENLKDLFLAQHQTNLETYTKVCFGYDREGFD